MKIVFLYRKKAINLINMNKIIHKEEKIKALTIITTKIKCNKRNFYQWTLINSWMLIKMMLN
jgi:hypothetical protein